MFNWLKEWVMNVFDLQPRAYALETKAEIWSIIEGPQRAEELDYSEIEGLDVHDSAVRLVLKISVDKEVFDIEAWFDSYADAKYIIDHFNKSIEPLPMNLGDFNEYV